MNWGTVIMWIVVVVIAAAASAAVGVLVLRLLARRADRFTLRELALDDFDEYVRKGASFAITVAESTPLTAPEVWARLVDDEYLRGLPLVSGPCWANASRGTGSVRSMSGTLIGVSERVIEFDEYRQITLSGNGVSVPLSVKGFGERFRVVEGKRGTLIVEWTVAGSPRWVGFLPWRLATPLVRPVLGYVLRNILRLQPLRSSHRSGGPGPRGTGGPEAG